MSLHTLHRELHATGITSEIVEGTHAGTGRTVKTIRIVLQSRECTTDLVFDSLADAALYVSGITNQMAAILQSQQSPVQVAKSLPF